MTSPLPSQQFARALPGQLGHTLGNAQDSPDLDVLSLGITRARPGQNELGHARGKSDHAVFYNIRADLGQALVNFAARAQLGLNLGMTDLLGSWPKEVGCE